MWPAAGQQSVSLLSLPLLSSHPSTASVEGVLCPSPLLTPGRTVEAEDLPQVSRPQPLSSQCKSALCPGQSWLTSQLTREGGGGRVSPRLGALPGKWH